MVRLVLIVGLLEIFQHTPLSTTVAPPLFVTSPPEVAVVQVISLTLLVVTIGGVNLSFLQEQTPNMRRKI